MQDSYYIISVYIYPFLYILILLNINGFLNFLRTCFLSLQKCSLKSSNELRYWWYTKQQMANRSFTNWSDEGYAKLVLCKEQLLTTFWKVKWIRVNRQDGSTDLYGPPYVCLVFFLPCAFCSFKWSPRPESWWGKLRGRSYASIIEKWERDPKSVSSECLSPLLSLGTIRCWSWRLRQGFPPSLPPSLSLSLSAFVCS